MDANAKVSGSFQGLGTRQNAYVDNLVCRSTYADRLVRFFSSYNSGASGWTYSLGQFAQLSLPLADSATLTIQRVNSTRIETVTVRIMPPD